MTEAERETQEEVMLSEFINQYLKTLSWSEDESEYVKTIVAGNIRAFAAHLRSIGALVLRESDLKD